MSNTKKQGISILGIMATCFFALMNLYARGSSESSSNSEKNYVIKVGHGVSEATALHKGWLKFKEIVETNSNGNIQVQIFPNQQLGGDRELIEAVQLGNVTMTSPSSAPLAGFDKAFYVFDMPFLFKNRAQVYSALDGHAGKKILDSLVDINLVGLGYWENGFRNLTNSKVPVRKPADLAGLKIRTMENEIHLKAWKMLGANPTPMAFGELFTALQQKVVDGQENPLELIYLTKFYEVQKYITKTQHIYTPYVVLINKSFFNDLLVEYQKMILDAVMDAGVSQRKIAMENEKEAEDSMKSKIDIISLTDEKNQAFKDKLLPITEDVKKKAGSDVVDTLLNAVK